MAIKTCKYCGKQFESKTGKQICDGTHTRFCEICGKEFTVPNNRLYETNLTCCSKECTNKKRSKNIKIAQSKLTGNWNKSKTVYMKTCKFCGKEFQTHQYNQEVCDGVHYKICSVCGKQYKVKNSNLWNPSTTCSKECSNIKTKETCLKKYGVDSYSKTQEWKNKLQQNKIKTHEKRKSTNLKLYGYENYSQTDAWLVKNMHDPSKLGNLKLFINNPSKFIHSRYKIKPTIQMLSKDLGINTTSVGQRIHNYKLEDLVSINYSYMENELVEIIRNINSSIRIIQNDRQQIKPYELDLYLPEYKIAFECNPTSTHNSSFGTFGPNDECKPPSYHKMKTDLCEKQGIFLFHIFGYEWEHKREVIESMIRNILGKTIRRVYARNTYIKEIDSAISHKFLDENHRQGFSGAKIHLGLFTKDTNELVSVMTFSHPRYTIGKESKFDRDESWELVRFCNLLNTSVIGGASKLFKYFIKEYYPKYIKSYSDRAHTRGDLYQILGFEKVVQSEANYAWIDMNTDIAYHRINAQKSNIQKFLNDEDIDLSKSEKQLMEEHEFAQVFDSGTILWEWINDSN